MLRGSQTNLKAFFQLSKNKRKLVSPDGLHVVQYTQWPNSNQSSNQQLPDYGQPCLVWGHLEVTTWNLVSSVRMQPMCICRCESNHVTAAHAGVWFRFCSSSAALDREACTHQHLLKKISVSSSYEFDMFIHNIKTYFLVFYFWKNIYLHRHLNVCRKTQLYSKLSVNQRSQVCWGLRSAVFCTQAQWIVTCSSPFFSVMNKHLWALCTLSKHFSTLKQFAHAQGGSKSDA